LQPVYVLSEKKGQSHLWGLLGSVFLLVGAFVFTCKAADENAAAKRQQTGFALLTECNTQSKGGNYCHYSFTADGRELQGADMAPRTYYYGDTKFVYYDSERPWMNSLDEFAGKAKEDRNYAYAALIAAVVVGLGVLFTK
jgi:hypothetical protein